MPSKTIVNYFTVKSQTDMSDAMLVDHIKTITGALSVSIALVETDSVDYVYKQIRIELPEPLDRQTDSLKSMDWSWRIADLVLKDDVKKKHQVAGSYLVHFAVGQGPVQTRGYETAYLLKSDIYWPKVKTFIKVVLAGKDDEASKLIVDDPFNQHNLATAKKNLMIDYRLLATDLVRVSADKMNVHCYVLNRDARKYRLLLIIFDADSGLIEMIFHDKKMHYPKL